MFSQRLAKGCVGNDTRSRPEGWRRWCTDAARGRWTDSDRTSVSKCFTRFPPFYLCSILFVCFVFLSVICVPSLVPLNTLERICKHLFRAILFFQTMGSTAFICRLPHVVALWYEFQFGGSSTQEEHSP